MIYNSGNNGISKIIIGKVELLVEYKNEVKNLKEEAKSYAKNMMMQELWNIESEKRVTELKRELEQIRVK